MELARSSAGLASHSSPEPSSRPTTQTPTSTVSTIASLIASAMTPAPVVPTTPPTTTTTTAKHVSNQSPITVYSSPHHQYHPPKLDTLDLMIVIFYILLCLGTSISTMVRSNKSRKRKEALAKAQGLPPPGTYLSRKMNWFTLGLSIFASNLGSDQFIGLSGSAAASGISVAAFELIAMIFLPLATWVILPVLMVSKISTLPEYMSKRFGGNRIRYYLSILAVLIYIFTKISVSLYSGGIFLQQAIGWNIYTSAIFILVLTCLLCLTGGLKGAMIIDNLQAIVITIGASIVSAKALSAVGGLEGLWYRYPESRPRMVPQNLSHCAEPNPRAFQLLRPADDNNMPWLGFLFGQIPTAMCYWATDNILVQRFFSAKSMAHAQGSSVFAGYLKILPLVFMVIPGMISRVLFPDEVACVDPAECYRFCQSTVSCSNTAYIQLVLQLLPVGFRGLMAAAMVAALMNDLANVFNSAKSLFMCDIYPVIRNRAYQSEVETAGKVFVIFLIVASIMWIPAIQEMQGGQLFIYIQSVGALIWPPIWAVYVCAMFWPRANEAGAFWALMIAFKFAMFKLALSFLYKEPSCGMHIDERPWILKFHYMYWASFLFLLTLSSVVIISLMTKPPAAFRLIRTTFQTRFDTRPRKDDKNIFEMKRHSVKLPKMADSNRRPLLSHLRKHQLMAEDSTSTNQSDNLSLVEPGSGSQQRLFTIEESNRSAADRTADLSSIVVDINAVAGKDQTFSAASSVGLNAKRAGGVPPLLRQASKGTRQIIKAATSHLTGGGKIAFKSLEGDDEEEEELDNDDDDTQAPHIEELESTTMDEEEDLEFHRGLQRRSKLNQSLISAFSKLKQKAADGYRKAAAFDDGDDGDDDEADDDDDDDDGQDELDDDEVYEDDDDEEINLNSSSCASMGPARRKLARGSSPSASRTKQVSSLETVPPVKQVGGLRRSISKRKHQRLRKSRQGSRYGEKPVEDDEEEEDELDNSSRANGNEHLSDTSALSLLKKSATEEILLNIAFAAVVLVALSLYIVLSIPRQGPPKDVVDRLNFSSIISRHQP